jgi:hypothetical protein
MSRPLDASRPNSSRLVGVVMPPSLRASLYALAERDNATLSSTVRRLLGAAIRWETARNGDGLADL